MNRLPLSRRTKLWLAYAGMVCLLVIAVCLSRSPGRSEDAAPQHHPHAVSNGGFADHFEDTEELGRNKPSAIHHHSSEHWSKADVENIRKLGGVYRSGRWIPAVTRTKDGRWVSTKDPDEAELQLFIITGVLPEGTPGTLYRVPFQAVGGIVPYNWTLVKGALPDGLKFTSAGWLTGTAAQPCYCNLTVEVSDSDNNSDVGQFQVVIQPEDQLHITTQSLDPCIVNTSVWYMLTAEGGVPPYQWSEPSGQLVNLGLTLNPSTGEITGYPNQQVRQPLTLVVTDSTGLPVSSDLELDVTSSDLQIVTDTLPGGQQGQPYTAQLTASGGVSPYSWALMSADEPSAGVSSDGTVYASPRAGGDFNLTVQVWDANGASVQATIPWHVDSSPTLVITTSELPACSQGAAYPPFQLQATGGDGNYQWSASYLPAGFNLSTDGLLQAVNSGSAAGSFPVQIMVWDNSGGTAQQWFSIDVYSGNDAPVTGMQLFRSLRRAALTWQNPFSPDYVRTIIIHNTDHAPADSTDGDMVYSGTQSNFTVENLGATPHFFAAFAQGADGSYSSLRPDSQASADFSDGTTPYPDDVVSFNPLNPFFFGIDYYPTNVLSAPAGMGFAAPDASPKSLVSIGASVNNDCGATIHGGQIELEFQTKVIVDGPGPDFTIFENVMYIETSPGVFDPTTRFMEPAVVSVSQDGQTWYKFPIVYSPRLQMSGGKLVENVENPYCYSQGFAGVNPVFANGDNPDPSDPTVSGGDSFDLADLGPNGPKWIRFIRIQSTGHNWMRDINGNLVPHTQVCGACQPFGSIWGGGPSKAGFDLDSICAIWFAPQPSQ